MFEGLYEEKITKNKKIDVIKFEFVIFLKSKFYSMLPFTAFSSDKRYSEDNKKMSVDVFCDEEPPSTRKVVMQLHALSADPDSQVSMVHEHSIIFYFKI